MDDILFWLKKSLDFYFSKLMLRVEPRALVNTGQVLYHGAIAIAHEKPLQVG